MNLKSAISALSVLAALVAFFVVAWKANAYFGYRRGEVDEGCWYVIRSTGGDGTYLQKGIDPENMFVDANEMQARYEALPEYVETVYGYGAVYIRIGWLNDAYIDSSGWRLFSTEDEAIEFLLANGVAENRIYFQYK